MPYTAARPLSAVHVKDILRKADCVCFDVDSTVCRDEAIDELAEYCGVGNEIRHMTARAMNGSITFREALSERLDIMKPSLDDIVRYIRDNPPKLTEGIRELIGLLHQRGTTVYLVSGGFQSIIIPVARELKISDKNIFANRLLFFHDGEYAGFDMSAATSEAGGKTRVVQHLKAKYGYKNLIVIGDGATDLETFPTADAFIGFGGNQIRDSVKTASPWFVTSFQELTDVLKKIH